MRRFTGRISLILKLNTMVWDCRVLSRAVDEDGNRAWLAAFEGATMPKAKAEADAYIARPVGRDPDVCVVEIEYRGSWHPFGGREVQFWSGLFRKFQRSRPIIGGKPGVRRRPVRGAADWPAKPKRNQARRAYPPAGNRQQSGRPRV